MLYNINDKEVRTFATCLRCPYHNHKQNKCSGIGKACFEYDKKTGTMIDPITKLPIKLK